MKVICVIPARHGSTRLPGKPLLDIAGKPMIQHVVERVGQAKTSQRVIVATDDERIMAAVAAFGGEAMLTAANHPTGTDRLAEVAQHFPDIDLVINVQGDEPLIPPQAIDALAEVFIDSPDLQMATLITEMEEMDLSNPAAVKVVASVDSHALYFSRSLIPYPRNPGPHCCCYKHIGVYAYRRDFLLKYAKLSPTPLEQTESLEQLRALEHGFRVRLVKTEFRSVGVDTEDDLQRVREIFRTRQEEFL